MTGLAVPNTVFQDEITRVVSQWLQPVNDAMNFVSGLVGLNARGNFSLGTGYVVNDYVIYGNQIYKCIAGIAPAVLTPDVDSTHWIPLLSLNPVSTAQLANIAALRAVTSLTLTTSTVLVHGYYSTTLSSAPDNGGGTFIRDATDTSSADNGGTVIIDASNRRWKRLFNSFVFPEQFGAKADGATDDTTAIQNAVNAVPEVHFTSGKTYLVSPQAVTNPEGGLGTCIVVNSYNILNLGTATIKQANGTTGTGSVIGNVNPVVGVLISGGTINCNSANTTQNMNGVVLFNALSSRITGVTVTNARWIGVGFRNPGSPAISYGDCKIDNCIVQNGLYIGIQVYRPVLGILVVDNIVETTADNSIDIEANNVSAGAGYGSNIIVSRNKCSAGLSGIFLESVGEAIVSNNTVSAFTGNGITLNRVNSGSTSVVITGNRIVDAAGRTGIYVHNTSGNVIIDSNYFRNLQYSVNAYDHAEFISMGKNLHESISSVMVYAQQGTNICIFSRLQSQDYAGSRTNGVPFTMSPLGNSTNYSTRSFAVTTSGSYFMGDGSAIATTTDAEYLDGVTGTLSPNPAWGGAYAVLVSGDTLIHDSTSTIVVGRYLKMGSYLYYVVSSPAGFVFLVRLVASNGDNSGTAGDYTGAPYNLNTAIGWTQYYSQWQTG